MTTRSTLTSLPTELIHDIAWLSQNPNLYLTCRSIRFRLLPQAQYLQDIALLLLCDRRQDSSAWKNGVLPWRTAPARRWNLNPTQHEREEMQHQIFDLESITDKLLVNMIQFTLRLWVTIYYPHTNNLSELQAKRLDTYLTSASDACLRSGLTVPRTCRKDHLVEDKSGHKLLLADGGAMSVSNGDEPRKRTKSVVSMLHVPTRLLTHNEDGECNELAKTLLYRTKMDSLNHMIVKRRVATATPSWISNANRPVEPPQPSVP